MTLETARSRSTRVPSAIRLATVGTGIGVALSLAYSLATPAAIATLQEWTEWSRKPVELTLATGFAETAQHVLGRQLEAEIERLHGNRLKVTVLATNGTGDNLRLLREGRANLGFVSSGGVVSFEGLRALAKMEKQYLHFIVPDSSPVTRLRDLAGLDVSLGPRDGAPYRFGTELMRFYRNFSFRIVEVDDPSVRRVLVQDLDAGRFQAAIRVTALHGANVKEPLSVGRYRLVPIDETEALAAFIPGFKVAVIPKGTYPSNPEAVPTLMADQMLVARADVSTLTARRVLETVFSDPFIRAAQLADFSEDSGQQVVGLPLHDGAVAYYHRNDPVAADRFEIAGFVLALAGLVGGLRLSNRRERQRVARSTLVEKTTAALTDLADGAESVSDPVALESLLMDAARINRNAIRDASKTGLRQTDLDLIQRAHDACVQTIRRRKRVVQPVRSERPAVPEGPDVLDVPGPPSPASPDLQS